MSHVLKQCYHCKEPIFTWEMRCNHCGSTNWQVPPGNNEVIPLEPRVRNGLPEFYELLEEAANIHDKKSHDYADNSDPLGNYRFAGEFTRLFKDSTDAGLIGRFAEKLYRLSNLDKKDTLPVNESIEDTETDMLVIIGLFVANRRKRRAT